ncbi:hypothetical protein KY284_025212 [Solanum tuberosum]|nr:hypothetical protein KY284_025212 [Solanum tuberosum]
MIGFEVGGGGSGSWAARPLCHLQYPRRVFKSSAKDSTRRSMEIVLQGGHRDASVAATLANDTCPWGPEAPTAGRQADGGLMRRF